MIRTEFKRLIFNVSEIWFSDSIYDVDGYSHVMFRHCKPQKDNLGFKCKEELTSIVDLRQDLKTIWEKMKKDSCRNAIKRAEKAGIEVKYNQNYDEFYEIYKNHLKNKKYHVIPFDKSNLFKYGSLFTAELNGELLGGHFYIEDSNHIVYHIGATKIINDNKRANTLKGNASHLMHWEAMKYAKDKGIQEFDMGGLYTDSINRFKESFGGNRTVIYNYWKDYNFGYEMAASLGRQFYLLKNFKFTSRDSSK